MGSVMDGGLDIGTKVRMLSMMDGCWTRNA